MIQPIQQTGPRTPKVLCWSAFEFIDQGSSNTRTLENFARVARRIEERPDPPLLIASTLLVPGYIDADEVGRIAGFIAGLNPSIP